MKQMVSDYNLKENVTFLGTLSSKEIAEEMNSTNYFLHNSDYETFSVVCAEALMCGTPVIASNVGAIPEYLTDEMGILVNDNSVESWKKVILNSLEDNYLFNNQNIALNAKKIFSKEVIGKKYNSILNGEN
jgi:glycosyltransferase involved in cell wall biosynthesis